jgi:hypothetical protein
VFAILFAVLINLHPATVQTGCPHLGICHPPIAQPAPCQGASHQAACHLPHRPAARP